MNPIVRKYDIVIYGGTSAGIIAAVQATQMGKSVAVIESSSRIGGLSSGGLGDTDFGDKAVIGGLTLEFYTRIGAKYGDKNPVWLFEPKVALEVFDDLVKENDIQIFYSERLDLVAGVLKESNRISKIVMESGSVFEADVFIDASYEGDVMAIAGISYTTGREANSKYGETYNGIQTKNAKGNQLSLGIDPYVEKGNSDSGLLPQINPSAGGEDGEGDDKIQAYCFRMCLTDNPDNRVMIEKPKDYSEIEYELMFRAAELGQKYFFKLKMLPNRKTDSNNDFGFSTDYIGRNYDYIEGDYSTRERIIKEHEVYQKGLLWTVQNHPRIPVEIREYYEPWGLPLDEFTDNKNWTPQLYIREARRMISDFVMNENHITLKATVKDPIGFGSYNMDSHNVQRYVDDNGFVRNEGDVQIHLSYPYPISFQAILPREEECSNLIVPVCLSSSHIAYGSIRMEPVFMVLGQASATAAVLAINSKNSVQKVAYKNLSEKLKEAGQIL